MKKLVFSAIAMIAFTGMSRANTIALEEGKIAIESNETTKAQPLDFCSIVGIEVLDELDPCNEMTPLEAHDTYRDAVELCESEFYYWF
jgi:hypothetical protein